MFKGQIQLFGYKIWCGILLSAPLQMPTSNNNNSNDSSGHFLLKFKLHGDRGLSVLFIAVHVVSGTVPGK